MKTSWSLLVAFLISFLAPCKTTDAARVPFGGIKVVPDTCVGDDLKATQNAILDAGYLAKAGMIAAASWMKPPFSMFFDSTRWNSHKVHGVYQRIMRAEQGSGGHIGVTCKDSYNRCNSTTNLGGITPAYSVQWTTEHRMPQIILCPAGLALPRDPEPCSAYPSGITLGWLMVHMMVHLKVISGPMLTIEDVGTGTARDVTDRVLFGQETIGRASAYAYLGGWSAAVGLGGPRRPPWNQKRTCFENLRKGNRDARLPSKEEDLRWRNIIG